MEPPSSVQFIISILVIRNVIWLLVTDVEIVLNFNMPMAGSSTIESCLCELLQLSK